MRVRDLIFDSVKDTVAETTTFCPAPSFWEYVGRSAYTRATAESVLATDNGEAGAIVVDAAGNTVVAQAVSDGVDNGAKGAGEGVWEEKSQIFFP